ncbi:triple tyrosine motif-containing protein [Clostridium sp.]|uniref:triple tyrosine motif-containing protein n=1 Tax=Clostridium sp. TaxID=1506 RepID=UPI003463DCAA
MNKVDIQFNLPSPQEKDSDIEIRALCDEGALYKFLIGEAGIWEALNDFSEENSIQWSPKKDGEYFVMVQCKGMNSNKPFDFYGKTSYSIGEKGLSLIDNIRCDKNEYSVGDKIELTVTARGDNTLYRYWILQDGSWEIIRDYCTDNILLFTLNKEGDYEILVEAKEVNSLNKFDDGKTIRFKVKPLNPVEIMDLRCLTQDDLMVDREVIFQVESQCDPSRVVLYKFYKVDHEGNITLIQDYSSKKVISYIEKRSGEYKLLVMAKDMYSKEQWDDRAILNYEIKPYKNIIIKNIITDLSSPQLRGREINIKVLSEGGNNLIYRYIIDGNYSIDSGFINSNEFLWKPSHEGIYEIRVMVKDKSYEGEYEALGKLEYVIDKEFYIPLRIKDVIIDKTKNYVKDETINVKVTTEGGIEPEYSFIVYQGDKEVSNMDFGSCNWVNFTPEEAAEYKMEIKIKDKYSLKDFDGQSILYFDVKEFVPGNIDYILFDVKEYYRVNDEISIEVVAQNTRNILVKYKLYINNDLVEETEYESKFKYKITPKCSGKYTIKVISKNIKSNKEWDCRKSVNMVVHEALPVTNTRIKSSKDKIICNEGVDFKVSSEGGKDVIYEFYLIHDGEWRRVQRYSKKNFYSFIPYTEGKYKVLVLSKSSYKSISYEDYHIYEFISVIE